MKLPQTRWLMAANYREVWERGSGRVLKISCVNNG